MSSHRREYIMLFFNRLFPFLTAFFLPVYLKSIDLQGWQIGILLAVSPLVCFLVSFPIGIINDKILSKSLVLISMLLVVVYYFGLGLVKSFWALLILFVIAGVSSNLFSISLQSLVMKRVGKDGKGKVFGFYALTDALGMSLGYFTGGYLLDLLSFKTVFMITGICFLAMTFYSLLLPKTETSVTTFKEYFSDLKNKQALLLALLFFLLAYHWGPEKTSVALFLKENVGLSLFQSGILMGIALFCFGVSGYFFGKKYDKKFSLKKIVMIGLLLSAIGSMGWYFTTNLFWVFILRVIHEVGDGAFEVFILLGIVDVFKKERIGGNSAFLSLVSVLGMIIGTVVSGSLGDVFGNAFPLFVSGLICLIGLLLVPKLKFS